LQRHSLLYLWRSLLVSLGSHRAWQLYVANIVLFVTLMTIISSTADLLKTSRYIEYFEGTSSFLQEPGLTLAKVLSLQFQPAFIDILPLYIACLGFLPFVLAGFGPGLGR
jgi:hypothetical protein